MFAGAHCAAARANIVPFNNTAAAPLTRAEGPAAHAVVDRVEHAQALQLLDAAGADRRLQPQQLVGRVGAAEGRPARQAGASCSGSKMPPLCAMARWNRPRAKGAASSALTDMAPADWPATVTRRGSPPKAAILRRTQRSAAIWSSRP